MFNSGQLRETIILRISLNVYRRISFGCREGAVQCKQMEESGYLLILMSCCVQLCGLRIRGASDV